MKEKKYLGFGVEKSVTGWAQFLDLPYSTVWRRLEDGDTPEEIAVEKGLTLDMSRLHELTEKDKRRMLEVKEIVADILDASDYDPDGLEVHIESEKDKMVIVWNTVSIGVYDYQKDALYLTGGDGLRIRHPLVSDLKIDKDENGKWVLHPDTKREIMNKQGINWEY